MKKKLFKLEENEWIFFFVGGGVEWAENFK